MPVTGFENMGIVVEDLKGAIAFFTDLGLQVRGETRVDQSWAAKISGYDEVSCDIVVMHMPDGRDCIEIMTYLTPEAIRTEPVDTPPHALGFRRVLSRRAARKDRMMAKYLLLKHYRGAPAAVNDVPMDKWTPDEVTAHVQYMRDFADRLVETGEFIEELALAPEGTFVRYDGEGRPPVTDGPFAETKDLIAGGMVIDVDSYERALELAAELSAAPGAGGEPIHEWLELRPFYGVRPTITE